MDVLLLLGGLFTLLGAITYSYGIIRAPVAMIPGVVGIACLLAWLVM